MISQRLGMGILAPTFVYLILLSGIELAVYLFCYPSPSSVAYSIICAWWAGLYMASYLGLGIRTTLSIVPAYFFLDAILWWTGLVILPARKYLQHDNFGINLAGSLIMAVFFASPIVINAFLGSIRRRLPSLFRH
jgi:hypothetical protein